jgi:hypothetical protein
VSVSLSEGVDEHQDQGDDGHGLAQ